MAWQPRLSFPVSSIKTTSPFELIHMDSWGPYSTPIYGGCKYFLTLVDDFTRATWTYLMGSKSNVFPLLKAFFTMVKTQFSISIKAVRSDNSLELGSSISNIQYFLDHRIVYHISCPHIPQQMVLWKESIGTLLKPLEPCSFSPNYPFYFGVICVLIATYLINRFPSTLLNNKSLFEILHSQAPSFSHLRTLGCLFFVTFPKVHRDKF